MGSAYPGFRPSFLMMIAAVLARAGEADSAHALMRSAREEMDPTDPWPVYFQANVHLNLGEADSALTLLSQFLEAVPDRKAYIATDYWWRPLREDPRFKAMVEE
jgi:predicted Zn-dependent protease